MSDHYRVWIESLGQCRDDAVILPDYLPEDKWPLADAINHWATDSKDAAEVVVARHHSLSSKVATQYHDVVVEDPNGEVTRWFVYPSLDWIAEEKDES